MRRGVHCVIPSRPTSLLQPQPRNLSTTAYQLPLSHRIHNLQRPALLSQTSHTSKNKNKNKNTTTTTTTTKYSARTMSDDAYTSFLEKANADLTVGQSQQQPQRQDSTSTATVRTKTLDVDEDAKIPAALRAVEAYYVSEADEPFEPVFLRWEGAGTGVWPGSCTFPHNPVVSFG